MKVSIGLLVLAIASSCVSAQFHSRNGQTYPLLTQRAVIVDPQEVSAVMAAGGQVIGTISSDGTMNKSSADLADKAAQVAAQRGGTHIVMLEEGEITTTRTEPATVTKQCSHDDDSYECTKTFAPETTSSTSRPTAEFQVIRVAPEMWGRLPQMLRPANR